MSVGFSIAVAVVNIIWGPELIRLFVGTGEREVVRLAQTYLNINASMYWVLALLFVFRYTLQGLGQSVVPTFAGVMELAMRAFAAIILARYLGFAGASMGEPRRMDRFLRAARHCLLLHEKEARTVHETALSPMLRGRTRIHTPGGITAGGKPSLLRSITADNARRPHHRFPDALNGCGHGAHFFPVVFQQSEGIELQSITFLHIFVNGMHSQEWKEPHS